MKKIAIIYGSSTGTTESIAKMIASKLNIASSDIYDVSKITPETPSNYDILILGSSTWGDGEFQDDWYDGIEKLKKADLNNKLVALFGCGDSYTYSGTFCDAMGLIYEELQGKGCQFIGGLSTEGYAHDASKAEVDGCFVGLALDESNQPDQTPSRIDSWLASFQDKLQ